jgi:hypothetical protein
MNHAYKNAGTLPVFNISEDSRFQKTAGAFI